MVAALFLLIGISIVWWAGYIKEEIYRIASTIAGIIIVVWSMFLVAPLLQLSFELAVLSIGVMKLKLLGASYK
jgi:hypothetical protein